MINRNGSSSSHHQPSCFRYCLQQLLRSRKLHILLIILVVHVAFTSNRSIGKSYDNNNGAGVSSGAVVTAQQRTELYMYCHEDSDASLVSKKAWSDFADESNMMILQDNQLYSTGTEVNIGVAHHHGLLHRGIWIAILRPSVTPITTTMTTTGDDDREQQQMMVFETFMLKRGPHLQTCPNAWGLVGEHSDENESWEETAKRALQEEIQLDLSSSPVKVTSSLSDDEATNGISASSAFPPYRIVNLLSPQLASILVKTYYENVHRYELQATAFFAIMIPRDVSLKLKFDDEVAEIHWIPVGDMLKVYTCNDEIFELLKDVQNRILTRLSTS